MPGLDEALDGEAAEDEREAEVLVVAVVELGEDVEARALGEAAEDRDEISVGGAEAEALAAAMEVHEACVAGEAEGLGGEGGRGVETGHGGVVLLLREAWDEEDAFGLGLAGVVADVAAGVLAEGREELVEGRGQGHAVAGGEGFHGLHLEMGEADLALVGGEKTHVQGVDAVGEHGLGGALEDFGLVLRAAEDGTASGEVTGDGVSGADAAHVVLGGEDNADEAGSAPAAHGAGAASVVGGGEEVERIEENVVFGVELLAQGLELSPGGNEVVGSAKSLALQNHGRGRS